LTAKRRAIGPIGEPVYVIQSEYFNATYSFTLICGLDLGIIELFFKIY
jgi:hypothetical protein